LFDVNVLGVWRCTRAAAKALTDSGGAIVNIPSVLSLGNAPLLGAYSATKAATLRITESLAFELRASGVRVNAVCPAFANTSMVERVAGPIGQLTKTQGLTFEELVQMKQMGLGRPEEVAEAVAFLVSGDASWTTGSAFTLDGADKPGCRPAARYLAKTRAA
jgi:galactitol 2-dehydrogenase